MDLVTVLGVGIFIGATFATLVFISSERIGRWLTREVGTELPSHEVARIMRQADRAARRRAELREVRGGR